MFLPQHRFSGCSYRQRKQSPCVIGRLTYGVMLTSWSQRCFGCSVMLEMYSCPGQTSRQTRCMWNRAEKKYLEIQCNFSDCTGISCVLS